jgi:hypothetical protein
VVTILLFDLRQRVPDLNKEEFDNSILVLAESEGYQLVRHPYPESLSKQELELMVPDGDGIFYCANAARERSVIDKERLATNTGAHGGCRSRVLARFHNGLQIG